MDGSPPQNGGRNYQANSPTTHDPYQYQANSTSSSSGSPSSNAYPSHGHTMQGSSYHQHHPQAGWAYGPGSGQSPPEGLPPSLMDPFLSSSTRQGCLHRHRLMQVPTRGSTPAHITPRIICRMVSKTLPRTDRAHIILRRLNRHHPTILRLPTGIQLGPTANLVQALLSHRTRMEPTAATSPRSRHTLR